MYVKEMNFEDHEFSPPKIVRNDSLVFSITAEKQYSPHQTDLLKDSSSINDASRDLFDIREKVKNLEGKIKSIKTQHYEEPTTTAAVNENFDCSNITNVTLGPEYFKPGCFVKKNNINVNPFRPSISNNFTKRQSKRSHKNFSRSHSSKKNSQSLNQSDISLLRKEILKLKMKQQRNKRSFSQYSDRLSESKSSVKKLKQENKKYDKIILNLNKQLRKSENIRKKQKETILKQKKQIEELKNTVNTMNKAARQLNIRA